MPRKYVVWAAYEFSRIVNKNGKLDYQMAPVTGAVPLQAAKRAAGALKRAEKNVRPATVRILPQSASDRLTKATNAKEEKIL